MIQLAACVLSKPAAASKSNTGKYAARATPISALADATRRSAAAMSGLRSSRAEGRPKSTDGGATSGGMGRHSSWKLDADSPTNTAIACSVWARSNRVSADRAWAVSSCAFA